MLLVTAPRHLRKSTYCSSFHRYMHFRHFPLKTAKPRFSILSSSQRNPFPWKSSLNSILNYTYITKAVAVALLVYVAVLVYKASVNCPREIALKHVLLFIPFIYTFQTLFQKYCKAPFLSILSPPK